MSSTRQFAIKQVLKGAPLNASFTTPAFNMQHMGMASIQIFVTTVSNTGLFTIECSNDPSDIPADANFDTVKLNPVIPAINNASEVITIDLAPFPYRWVRIKFTLGTGTDGSCSAVIVGKGA